MLLIPEYRSGFVEYWKRLGDQIGQLETPIAVPKAAAETVIRPVRMRLESVRKSIPLDTKIIYQRLNLPPEQVWDLIIGTNIFVYYGEFGQSLARAKLAAMLKAGGYLLTTTKCPTRFPPGLKALGKRDWW